MSLCQQDYRALYAYRPRAIYSSLKQSRILCPENHGLASGRVLPIRDGLLNRCRRCKSPCQCHLYRAGTQRSKVKRIKEKLEETSELAPFSISPFRTRPASDHRFPRSHLVATHMCSYGNVSQPRYVTSQHNPAKAKQVCSKLCQNRNHIDTCKITGIIPYSMLPRRLRSSRLEPRHEVRAL